MERSNSILSLSSRSSSNASTRQKFDPILPFSRVSEKSKSKFPNPFTHCLYRRVLTWTLVSLALVSFLFLGRHDLGVTDVVSDHLKQTDSTPEEPQHQGTNSRPKNEKAPDAIVVVVNDPKKSKSSKTLEDDHDDDDGSNDVFEEDTEEGDFDQHRGGATDQQMQKALSNLQKMPWLKFPHLNGFYHGVKTIVNKAKHKAEYPNSDTKMPFRGSVKLRKAPKQVPYNPYNASEQIQTCYLDADNKVPAPSMYVYEGVPEHMPDPTMGSYNLLGLRDDVCFDRFGRYGPYGLGYHLLDGGTSIGLDTERSRSEEVWEESGQINYGGMNWGDAQERCVARNIERFRQLDDETDELEPETAVKKSRMAVVVRLYTGFKWTYLAVLNFRALITELSLKSGGEYTVHFLMHVRDNNVPIWADDGTVQHVLDQNVPPEFHSMVTLWSEAQMRLFYPGKFGSTIQNPSGQDIHGVYRSAHLPLQVFALQHPEYEHYWNWEMDMRFLGNYYELFDRLGKWADNQPREELWERSARYYIPSYHGSWENFTDIVSDQTAGSGQKPIFGPLQFQSKQTMSHELRGESVLPDSCAVGQDRASCGVGEKADLITLNPIFDIEESGWVFMYDATGYTSSPPRRCAIITAGRLSRRLLMAMHEEVWKHHHSMFSEMFPPSVALHHGFKAAYAPHPVYLDRAWDPQGSTVDAAFNAGKDHSTSGKGSPYDLRNEHNHKGTSWYYNSEFAGMLWRRWLGYAQMDGRGRFGGQIGKGQLRGGKDQEEAKGSTGRMCLRSVLLHPIKREAPSE